MPKSTFFKLKKNRQKQITDAVLDELLEHGFQKTSVNRIIKKAKIATGSFYQYFENTEDVIVYILKMIGKEKLKCIQAEVEKMEEKTFENYIRSLYAGGIIFALENKRYCSLAESIIQIKGTELYKKLLAALPKYEIYNELYLQIQNAISNGKLKDGISAEFAIQLMIDVNTSIIKQAMNFNRNHKFEVNEHTLKLFSELGVSVLLDGIMKREEN